VTVRLFSDLLSVLLLAKGEKTAVVLNIGEAASCQPSFPNFFTSLHQQFQTDEVCDIPLTNA